MRILSSGSFLNRKSRAAGRRPPDSGFTLIELLVALSILLVLTSLLLPTLRSMVSHAREMQCVGKLRNTSAILLNYASENGATLAAYNGASAWMKGFKDYAELTDAQMLQLLNCPSNPKPTHWLKSPAGGLNYALVYKPFGFGKVVTSSDSFRPAMVTKPSLLALISDACVPAPNALYSDYKIESGTMQTLPRIKDNAVHGDGINIAFFDGSIRKIPLADVDSNWWTSVPYQNR